MISVILNIIGVILILIAIITIRKDLSKSKSNIDDLNLIEKRIKDYYNLTEDIVEDFSQIIDTKLEEINDKSNPSLNKKNQNLNNGKKILSEIDYDSVGNEINELHRKILKLSSIGLNNEEIAKRLNKGKREVDIILKIYKDKKIGKTI